MRRCLLLGLVIAAFAVPRHASAQDLQPHAGNWALCGAIGLFVPDEDFHGTYSPEGAVEFYPIARVSARLSAGWARPNFVNGLGSLEQTRIAINAVYNWETGDWHPYVTAGTNLQLVRYWLDDDTAQDKTHQRWGFNLGGGVEYFVRSHVAFRFELAYFLSRQAGLPGSPAGLSVSAGIKKYFN
jgi:hypothetical protein